jgi:hypothetical protein
MSEWIIPITDEIVTEMGYSGLPLKFEPTLYHNSFEGYSGFEVMMGSKYDKSFEITTKDGKTLSTVLAYGVAYYFDAEGIPKAIIIPLAHQLNDGRVIINNNMFFLPWTDKGWVDIKQNNKDRYNVVFSNTNGGTNKTLIPIDAKTPVYSPDQLKTNAVFAFWHFIEYPYRDAWKTELKAVLTTGDNSKLHVILDFREH